MSENSDVQYEVLSPWAVVDPVPLRSPAPRLDNLEGKTIGLFNYNFKSASAPMLTIAQENLKERFPTARFSWFEFNYNQDVTETEHKGSFEEWVKGVDTVIAAVGD